jgi:hypothetical protein
MDHPHLRMNRLGALALVAIGVLALGACSNSASRALVSSTTTTIVAAPDLPDRPAALQPPPGFVVPDTRNVIVAPVVGKPGAAAGNGVAVRGGRSAVNGVVNGPDGPVAGATVLIERFVGTASAAITTTTDGSGQFSVGSLLGGRYRARAWLAPSLTTVDSATGFMADGDRLSFTIGVERHDAVSLQLAPGVAGLTVGQAVPVNGLLTQESVDGNGIVHTVGLGGTTVTLTSSGSLSIAAPNPATTGGDGRVQWNVTCLNAGTIGVNATAGTPAATAALTLPDCVAAPPPTAPGPP